MTAITAVYGTGGVAAHAEDSPGTLVHSHAELTALFGQTIAGFDGQYPSDALSVLHTRLDAVLAGAFDSAGAPILAPWDVVAQITTAVSDTLGSAATASTSTLPEYQLLADVADTFDVNDDVSTAALDGLDGYTGSSNDIGGGLADGGGLTGGNVVDTGGLSSTTTHYTQSKGSCVASDGYDDDAVTFTVWLAFHYTGTTSTADSVDASSNKGGSSKIHYYWRGDGGKTTYDDRYFPPSSTSKLWNTIWHASVGSVEIHKPYMKMHAVHVYNFWPDVACDAYAHAYTASQL